MRDLLTLLLFSFEMRYTAAARWRERRIPTYEEQALRSSQLNPN